MTIEPARVAATLTRGRRAAEARMMSRVTVWRNSGRTVQNETTGREEVQRDALATDVPFRLKGGRSRTVTISGIEFEEATAEGHLPADVDSLLGSALVDEDQLEITSGDWAGTTWRVVEAIKGDQQTARRVPIREV